MQSSKDIDEKPNCTQLSPRGHELHVQQCMLTGSLHEKITNGEQTISVSASTMVSYAEICSLCFAQ